jgi:hypothetical protein
MSNRYTTDIGHDVFTMTAHDSNIQPKNRGGWVAVAGTVTVQNRNGTNVALGSLAVGTYIPFAINILRATGTTATVLGIR